MRNYGQGHHELNVVELDRGAAGQLHAFAHGGWSEQLLHCDRVLESVEKRAGVGDAVIKEKLKHLSVQAGFLTEVLENWKRRRLYRRHRTAPLQKLDLRARDLCLDTKLRTGRLRRGNKKNRA